MYKPFLRRNTILYFKEKWYSTAESDPLMGVLTVFCQTLNDW